MNNSEYILVSHLCTHYAVEQSLLYDLQDNGLLEITTIKSEDFLHQDCISTFEKILRIRNELKVNIEQMDLIINLLDKIEVLQNELNLVKNRLMIYE